jgi:two-component system, OmpR family, phosphate regulon response regulator PhoB
MSRPLTADILLVEDDAGIQELLRFTLEQAGFRIRVTERAERAVEMVRDALPDLVILDWMLPGQSGIQFARQLRTDPRCKALPIIMVTARGEEPDRIAGLEEGADDYIVKPFSPKELVARVHAVLRRRSPELGNSQLSMGPLRLDTTSYEAWVNDRKITLTPIEFKLLRFLMANPGRVYSRAQLLDHVWGDHVYVEERTVDVHVRRLRVALGEDADQLIETVRGAGYKMIAAGAIAR